MINYRIDIEDEQTQDTTLAPLLMNDETISYGHNKGNLIAFWFNQS